MKARVLTKELYEDLPNMSRDLNIHDEKSDSLKYVGFGVIEILKDSTIKSYCGKITNFLLFKDVVKINDWYYSERIPYLDSYYRLDFDQYIYIFQKYEYGEDIILLGNLLKKDFDTRLNLIQHYQDFLMRALVHG